MVAVLFLWTGTVSGQTLDERFLRSVHDVEDPRISAAMRGIDASSYPIFLGTPVLIWTFALTSGCTVDLQNAWNVSITGAATYGVIKLAKHAFGRPRPFREVDGIQNREPKYLGIWPESVEDYSFPSGHASLAFALATSISISYTEWYVVLPAYAWASGVALGRVWHGVHYPTDVLAGALLGGGLAFAVDRLAPALTPGVFRGGFGEGGGPRLSIIVPVGR
jgi:membrane-associated phospholipid phosphatase